MSKKQMILVALGIVFISFNLRAPITAVGSLVELIKTEYALSNAVSGLITTLPLIAFAVVSPFVAKISKKIGGNLAMTIGLFFMLFGEIIRSYLGVVGLFLGTIILGIGIAIGNVLIPSFIKLHFPNKIGLLTSIYTSSMCIFAAVGAGVSLPIAKGLNIGWKNSLAVWGVMAIITILIWLPQLFVNKSSIQSTPTIVVESKTKSVWTNKIAWMVTLFMGIQSLLFYSLVAWLPTIVISKGMSESFASNMALMYQLLAIPITLLIPILCDKFKNQSLLVLINCTIYLVGMIMFLFAKEIYSIVIAIILLSFAMGGSISLSISFISLRSENAFVASNLSGMSQSAGYLLAAVGPSLMGAIFDFTYTWTLPICIFIVLVISLAIFGYFAGKDKKILG